MNDGICILPGSPGYDCTCYTEIGANDNAPYSLNVVVNYHYHGKNRVVTR